MMKWLVIIVPSFIMGFLFGLTWGLYGVAVAAVLGFLWGAAVVRVEWKIKYPGLVR